MSEAIQKTEGAEVAPQKMATQAGQLLAMVTQQGASPETLEMVAKLYRDEREDTRRTAFNSAMAEAQTEMRPVAEDSKNPQTHSEYASYAALDKALRPIYTQHGFGLSFGTEDVDKEDVVRVVCVVSHRDGYERKHHIDMPADGTGIKGNRMMTATHATGAATTYGMRYLLKMIFNVAVGEDDNDGNMPQFTIGPDQAKHLREMVKQAGFGDARKKAMLGYANASRIEEIPEASYQDIVNVCLKEIKKQQGKGKGKQDDLPY